MWASATTISRLFEIYPAGLLLQHGIDQLRDVRARRPPCGWPHGAPKRLFHLLGRTEFARHQGFAHTVSRTGTYLSKTAGVREGEALAYLIAPPLEAVVGLDEALKASDVELAALFEPPSETNFGGGLLTGTQSACNAACAAFAEAVKAVAARPREI